MHQEKFQGEKEKIVYLSGHTKKKKKNFKREHTKNKDEARSFVAGAFTDDGGGNGVVGRR